MNGAGGQGAFDLTGSGAEPLRERDPRWIGTIPLVGRLGAGGMGRVYLGVVGGRYAAVKQMLASVVAEDEGFLRRFGQEMDNLARLPAEATAPLLASDRDAEPPWFATAYVPGITLAEAVEPHGGPLPADSLWRLLRGVAGGLVPVHALGMVHRDLKPSNVMLTLDGVTLIDFGIARAAEQSHLTQTGLIVGTPAYMSPEQASGKRRLGSASDVFTLGLLVAYGASGRWPFKDDAEGSPLYRIVHDFPDLGPLRALDPRLAETVAACLDKDPEGRPTAAELFDAAAEHAPAPPAGRQGAGWPPHITDRLAGRAAFAAKTPPAFTPPAPNQAPTAPTPAPVPATPVPATPETSPDATSRHPERHRRTRVLMAVVPVVVIAAGTTLALQNLPYITDADRATDTPPSASAPLDPAASPDAKGTAEASDKAKKKRKKQNDKDDAKPNKDDDARDDAKNGSGTNDGKADGNSSGSDTDTEADSGKGTGTGTGTGSGSSDDKDDAGHGNGGGGSDDNTGDDDSPTTPTTGPFRLKNADNGSCLIQVYGSADDGSCGDPSASWKTVSAENNSFKVVNKQSGSCLVANMLGQAVFVGDCTQGAARLWRWGPNATLRSTSNGGCLDLAYGGGVAAATCQPGKASQKWTR
ncbi:protein kinase [Streptomyces sp. NPDC023327]|uniref:serine/threonine-protein kinase n=1 Tax=Streptomyces sp. NPDC023327 TaxID=3157088 RepID=UPI003409A552